MLRIAHEDAGPLKFPGTMCMSEEDVVRYIHQARDGCVNEIARDHLIGCERCRVIVQARLLGDALADSAHIEGYVDREIGRWRVRITVWSIMSMVVLVVFLVLGVIYFRGSLASVPSGEMVAQEVKSGEVESSVEDSAQVFPEQQDEAPVVVDMARSSAGADDPRLRSIGDIHGSNSVIVIEISDYPQAIQRRNTHLARLTVEQRAAFDKWFEDPARLKKSYGENAFLLIEPADHDYLMMLLDREVVGTRADHLRVFRRLGEALEPDPAAGSWSDVGSIEDIKLCLMSIPGFKLRADDGSTEMLGKLLAGVDVPILLVHDHNEAHIAKGITAARLGMKFNNINFIEDSVGG